MRMREEWKGEDEEGGERSEEGMRMRMLQILDSARSLLPIRRDPPGTF
jgi:hypothetical protein